ADTFEHGVRADILRQLLDASDARFAAVGHDVGRAIFDSQVLAALVTAHRDDAGRTYLLGREHAHEADRAVTDDSHRRSFPHAGGDGRIPDGTEHVRHG